MQIRNSFTGFAVNQFSLYNEQGDSVSIRYLEELFSDARRSAERFSVESPGFKRLNFKVFGETGVNRLLIYLDPIHEPHSANPAAPNTTRIHGFVADEYGIPLAEVNVSHAGNVQRSNAEGYFSIDVPIEHSIDPEFVPMADLSFEKSGFSTQIHEGFLLTSGLVLRLQVSMVSGNGIEVVPQSKFADSRLRNPQEQLTVPTLNQSNNQNQRRGSCLPGSIRVGQSSSGGECCTGGCSQVGVYSLDTYVKRVLPSEWLISWSSLPNISEAYKAASVAIRSYAAWHTDNSASGSYDICSSPCCQVFGSSTSGVTNSAVDATDGWVLKSGSQFARAEYSSENNNLAGTHCSNGWTNGGNCNDGQFGKSGTGTPCYNDPPGQGYIMYGHGRGMSQFGSARWASGRQLGSWCQGSPSSGPSHGYGTKNWRGILSHYYSYFTQSHCNVTNCSDPHEPNDNSSNAENPWPSLGTSNYNGTFDSYISAVLDKDLIRVRLTAPGTLEINLLSLPEDYDLHFLDASLQPIAHSWNAGTTSEQIVINYTLSQANTYYIEVESGPGAYDPCDSYRLTVSWNYVPPADATQPILSSPANGGNAAGTNVEFTYSADHAVEYWMQLATDNSFQSLVVDQNIGGVETISIGGFGDDGTTYYWRVKAAGTNGNWSPYSATRSFTNGVITPAGVPVPAAPANGSNQAGTEVTFQFNSSNANEYWMQISTNAAFNQLLLDASVGNTTSMSIGGFPDDGTIYYWRVKARNNNTNWSNYSNTRSFTNGQLSQATIPNLQLPADGANASGNEIEFQYQANNANEYWIQISRNIQFNNLVYDASVGGSTTTTINGFNDDGTTYYWRVRARNSVTSWTGYSSVRSFVNGIVQNANTPVLQSPADRANVSGSTVNFQFSANNASEYWLQVSTSSSFAWSSQNGSVGNQTSVNVNGLPNNGVTVYWRVKARSGTGNWSAFSPTWSFVNGEPPAPLIPAPINPLNESNVSGGTVSFTYSADHATFFWLQVARDSDFRQLIFDQDVGGVTTSNVSGFNDNGETFFWRVRARNSSHPWTGYSPTRSFVNGTLNQADIPVLNTPTNGASVTGTQIQFTYSAANATEFWLQVAAESGFNQMIFDASVGNVTTANVSGFTESGRTFHWRVKARNGSGQWSLFSNAWTFTNDPANPQASVPALLSPENRAQVPGDTVTFNYEATNATDFWIQVATDDQFLNPIIDTSVGGSTTLDVNGFPQNGIDFFWRVKARNNGSAWSAYSPIQVFTTISAEVDSFPTLISPENAFIVTDTMVTLFYEGTGFTEYWLQVADDSSFNYLVLDVSNGLLNSASLNGFNGAGSAYWWRVKGRTPDGSWSAYSPARSFSDGVAAQQAVPPTLLTPENNTFAPGNAITFNWQAQNTDENWLQLSRNTDFTNLVLDESVGSDSSTTITGFVNLGQTFYWRMRGRSNGGPWSAYGDYRTFVNRTTPTHCPPMSNTFVDQLGDSRARLNWVPATTLAGGYELKGNKLDEDGMLTMFLDGTESQAVNLPRLEPATGYFWQVRSVCGGEIPFYGTWSETDTFFTKCSKPDQLELDSASCHTLHVSWRKNATGHSAQQIRGRRIGSTNGQWLVRTIAASRSSLTVDNLPPSTQFEWQIRTLCDQAEDSEWSLADTVSTTACKQAFLSDDKGFAIEVSPNPSNGRFSIKGSGLALKSLRFYDLFGSEFIPDHIEQVSEDLLNIKIDRPGVFLVKLGENGQIVRVLIM